MWQGPIISIECAKQPLSLTPMFVDPRTVADSTLSIKEEPSPLSSPITSSRNSGSRSVSPDFNQFPFPEEGVSASPQIFEIPHDQFNYTPDGTKHVNAYPHHADTVARRIDTTYIGNAEPRASIGQRCVKNGELTPPPPPTVRRRGPGRPSKAQSAAHFPNNKRPTGHSAVKLRRQMHNDSAMRSRARLNKALEELWTAIPNQERNLQPEIVVDDNREVCRAVKVEVAINYLKKLQAQLSSSQGWSHGA